MLPQQMRETTLTTITLWIRSMLWTAWIPRTSTAHWILCASHVHLTIPSPCAAHQTTFPSWPLWPRAHCPWLRGLILSLLQRQWPQWHQDQWWGWGWGILIRDTHTIAHTVIHTCHTHTSPHTHTPPHAYNHSQTLVHTGTSWQLILEHTHTHTHAYTYSHLHTHKTRLKYLYKLPCRIVKDGTANIFQ